ncbi:MAG: PEP-CTERM sorting domain-containing protein [Proteobacteria bacterium]|nr:PEP-CTERM sorting domain-containing protein [Pseudomonadota bacterium]MBU1388050.1 PEP-CTERM sorting domain-containing protein [Pseudomonadota bacterium]MBU1542113.1 PEP-CTERM sorting domain-containing protein [Pseudomonadota bacterium]MBU2482377.1 PEP-CTERM sorting domain-containing protein [Pseudomonadota bacterium]
MKKILFLIILFSICFSSNGFALYVDVSAGKWNHTFYNVDKNGDGNYDNDPNYNDTYSPAGNFNLEFKVDENSPTYYSSYGFCVDITVLAGSGSALINNITTDSFKKSAWVLENFWSTGNTGTQNAGIQLAIWDLIYAPTATGFDPFVPLNTHNSGLAAFNEYTAIIAEFNAKYPANGFDASKYIIVNFDDKQDMITTNPVPEPATMALFGIGLLGIALVGRKRS